MNHFDVIFGNKKSIRSFVRQIIAISTWFWRVNVFHLFLCNSPESIGPVSYRETIISLGIYLVKSRSGSRAKSKVETIIIRSISIIFVSNQWEDFKIWHWIAKVKVMGAVKIIYSTVKVTAIGNVLIGLVDEQQTRWYMGQIIHLEASANMKSNFIIQTFTTVNGLIFYCKSRNNTK